jgi:hypothetical protein
METNTNLIVFFDTVGRTIIGEKNNEQTTDKNLVVKNPAVVHISPNQSTGQLTLQILPLFFKEFLADKSGSTCWSYKRDFITEATDVTLDFKLQAQYQQLFSGTPTQQPQQPSPQASPEIVKLFDDE